MLFRSLSLSLHLSLSISLSLCLCLCISHSLSLSLYLSLSASLSLSLSLSLSISTYHVFILIKGDAGLSQTEEALVCLKVTEILTAATMVQGMSLSKERTEEVTKDLSLIALKFSGLNMTAAICCLAHFAEKISKSPLVLLNLAEKCFSSIVEIAKIISNDQIDLSSPPLARTVRTVVSVSQAARIQRCLVVLGSICEHSRKCQEVFKEATILNNELNIEKNQNKEKNKFNKIEKISLKKSKKSLENIEITKINEIDLVDDCDFNFFQKSNEETAKMEITEIKRLTANNMNGCTYAACMYALTIDLPPVQARAVQSLCGVFIGCPRLILLLQDNRLMDRLLSFEFPDIVKEKFLISLRDMMMAEEVECSVFLCCIVWCIFLIFYFLY